MAENPSPVHSSHTQKNKNCFKEDHNLDLQRDIPDGNSASSVSWLLYQAASLCTSLAY